jgi:predicted dehydrogenase
MSHKMKKIGFIDYYLDEWHAKNYPTWLSEASNGNQIVAYAYGEIDAAKGISNTEWCKTNGVEKLNSIEEVVEKSDCIVVLSPDNPEQHEHLSRIPLMSGKRVYIDKTFSNTRVEAIKMFELADKYNTPMYSSSALRFSKELESINKENIDMINSRGPGTFSDYSIHQLEPIVALMGTEVKRVMSIGTINSPALAIEFSDGRKAIMSHFGSECPFGLSINYKSGNALIIDNCTDFFPRFIQNMADFFETGDIKVTSKETIAIITLRECGYEALDKPGKWIEISHN